MPRTVVVEDVRERVRRSSPVGIRDTSDVVVVVDVTIRVDLPSDADDARVRRSLCLWCGRKYQLRNQYKCFHQISCYTSSECQHLHLTKVDAPVGMVDTVGAAGDVTIREHEMRVVGATRDRRS